MKIVNCKGLVCPMPLIETKKAIRESKYLDILCVEVDNETAYKNVFRFLSDNGIPVEDSKEGSIYKLKFKVPEKLDPNKKAEDYCEITVQSKAKGNNIIVLNSCAFGSGNDDLGKLLMKGFINTIPELEELPQEIICYNSAVTLATKGSDTGISLKKIESLGVKITLCGTCVDFYSLKENLEVGSITNMLYIAEKLCSDSKIIRP